MEDKIRILFDRYYNKTASEEERAALFSLLQNDDPALAEALQHAWQTLPDDVTGIVSAAQGDGMVNRILGKQPEKRSARRTHFLGTAWFRYAAILLLIAGTATYLYFHSLSSVIDHTQVSQHSSSSILSSILPGGNKAILTLSDGSTILLDSVTNGALADQGGTRILKLNAGELTYEVAKKMAPGEVLFNTITTPRGGQYQVTLPDGSKVWLNAASSIRFPTSFRGNERKVTVTGEAYFEVAGNRASVFLVEAGTDIIQVLGTRFNTNSYPDEGSVKTSLLDGAIKIGSTVLEPGEAYSAGKIVRTNLEQDLAWTKGVFHFTNAALPAVMRQLARWYDVDIAYEGNVRLTEMFNGTLKRSLNLNDVLFILEKSQVHFRISGRQLTVLP